MADTSLRSPNKTHEGAHTLSYAQANDASALLSGSMYIDQQLLDRTTYGDGKGQAELYELLSNEKIDKKAFLSYYVRR